MSDLEKLFKHAPESAVKLGMLSDGGCARWFNKDGKYFSGSSWMTPMHEYVAIATRLQQKTIADAYEWVRKGNKICGYSFAQNKMLSFCKDNNTYAFVSETSSSGSVETENWQPVCTREQFEDYVKQQEGEKWTHMYYKDKCRIKVSEPDSDGYIVIVTDFNGYQLCTPDELKPIKPTISKAEAWDKLKDLPANEWSIHSHVMELENKYDII